MTTAARLGLFAVFLVAVFAGAAAIGGAADPSGSEPGGGHAAAGAHEADHGGGTQRAEAAVPGLTVAAGGYRLALERRSYDESTRPQGLAFQILDDEGRPVRNFDVAHEKRMHVIVVRRDFAGFQHVHPRLHDDGTWTQPVTFADGGTYRVFADFTRDGRQHTLGADVQVSGDFRAAALPAPRRSVRSDGGLEVTLRAHDRRLAFDVRDRGQAVNDRLEQYLGSKGHLVALREGDLAYLHTHPADDALAFETTFPSASAYRLFVQFSYEGRIHTAAFTHRVPR